MYREICKEMIFQRGYTIEEETDDNLICKKGDKKLGVFFTLCPKFNTEKAQEYIGIMNDMDINHSIIVYKNSITPSAKKLLENLPDSSLDGEIKMKIEIFPEMSLRFNITKHRLQPNFEKVDESFSLDMRKKLGSKLPILLQSDPIAKFYGFNIGDIIKVSRKSGHVMYRIVR